jgi:hypothetical protein
VRRSHPKTPNPEELEEIRAMLAEVRRDVRELIEFLQARVEKRPT